ncbi:lysophosphatidic acid receptor 2 isoform X2 [Chelonoidis abingdonii]|uniref:lysophosphatidic acid receptor 2 isoform X2 n=1 Tax=Chelonoidis abingdonii TaxID=106734 RepID=UPI003F49187B
MLTVRFGCSGCAFRTVKMKHCYYNESVGFFYNNSRKELTSYWRTKDVLVVALGLTVSVIVLLTNLLVISAIIINRRFHYPIYYLLGNLAAADLFAGIAYMFLMFHTGPRTAELSLRTWFIRQSLLDTSLTASVVNLLAIAVERHQTVFTMQLHSSMSNQRVVILIICIWVTALLLGLIPSYGWHCLCDLGNCSRMAPLYSRSYLTFWALSNLVIFLIMVVVYTHIFVYVKRKMTRMSKHTSFHPRYKETMINLIKTVIIILTAYLSRGLH